MPTVLFYTSKADKGREITALCNRLGFRSKALKPADAGCTVGSLAGLPGASKSIENLPAGYSMPELIIFSGGAGEALDVFLAAYRKAGIEPVALKAVVTPHNAAWTVRALAEELQRERAAMLLYRQKQANS